MTVLSTPCACGQERIPRLQNVVVSDDHTIHRLSTCSGPRIVSLPTFAPPAPKLITVVCPHGERWWATGETPEDLWAELGCGCEVAA